MGHRAGYPARSGATACASRSWARCRIPPGHDAWVVGREPVVALEFPPPAVVQAR